MVRVRSVSGDIPRGLSFEAQGSRTARGRTHEIRERKDMRPWIRHVCGHVEQVACVGVGGDPSQEYVLEREKDGMGGTVLVGPPLSDAIDRRDGRLIKVNEYGDEFIVPLECSRCERDKLRQGRHGRSSAPVFDVPFSPRMMPDEDDMDISTPKPRYSQTKVFP